VIPYLLPAALLSGRLVIYQCTGNSLPYYLGSAGMYYQYAAPEQRFCFDWENFVFLSVSISNLRRSVPLLWVLLVGVN
jgi:hypothetical protein